MFKEILSGAGGLSSKRVFGSLLLLNGLAMKWYLLYKVTAMITSSEVMINLGNVDSISSGIIYAGCALIGAGVIEGFAKKE